MTFKFHPILRRTKLICLFAHYNASMKVSDYVITYLEHLEAVGFEILFISNSAIKDECQSLIAAKIPGCRIFQRENEGADFGGWKWAIEQNLIPKDTEYLLLTNDSLYGPVFPLDPILKQMESKADVDFWGLTENFQREWHLQSYFLLLSKRVFSSHPFKKVFSQQFEKLTKRQIIERGELLLSKSLSDYGFKGMAYIPYRALDPDFAMWDAKNPTHYFWDKLIEKFNFPFVKKELILQNPDNIPNIDKVFPLIQNHSSYPVENIKQSISDFLASCGSSGDFPNPVSVLAHLYYPGSIYYFLSQLTALKSPQTHFVFNVSALLLHDTFFLQMVKKHFPGAVLLYTPNQGRDIGGKLAALDALMKCNIHTDYTLVIHDKLSPHTATGIEWRNKLFQIISPKKLSNIFQTFDRDKDIGVIAAKEFIQNEFDAAKNKFTCTSNDNILHYIKKFNLNTSDYGFAAGTIFWIRTEILRDFFAAHSPLSIRQELEKGNSLDFEKGTNIHAWERLFSFVAHSQGFKTIGV